MTRPRLLPLLAMGCRWSLDTSVLPDDVHDALARRWSRAVGLDADPAALVLGPERQTIAITTTDRPAPSDAAGSVVLGDLDALPYDLSREVTRCGITRLRGQHLLLHAAALSDDRDRAVVLVAPSGGGKSTATSVLGRHLGYLTDESVVVTAGDELAPYPKPPSLVVDPAHRALKDEPAPDDLGLLPTPSRPHLTALLTLRRDPATTTPSIEPVGLLDQLLAVLPETSAVWMLPDGLDRLARAVSVGGGPHELRYAEIETCVDLVREHLRAAAEAPARVTWRRHAPQEEATPVSDPAVGPGPVDGATACRRASWTDAVEADGQVLVLRGPEPVLLSGVGALAWLMCAQPCGFQEILDRAVDDLGEHPDARDLVRQALDDLVAAGVLEPA